MKSLLIAFAMVAATAQAADNSSTMSRGTSSSVDNPTGFVPLIGAGVGAMSDNDTLQTGGTPSEIKILGSYYFSSPIVADLGIGLMNQQFSQSEGRDSSVNGASYELAARYKFGNRWSIGPVVEAFGGNSNRYGSSDSNLTSFGGAQLMKEFTVARELLLRAGIRGMTDLNIRDQQVNVGMIDLELGWVRNRSGSSTNNENNDNSTMSYNLDVEKFHFPVGKAEVENKEASNLRSLSSTLAKHAALFEKVEIIGHADQTGPDALNDKLSQNRAQTVAQTLIHSGLPAKKVETVGKGEKEPLVDSLQPEALRQNRRVEMKFIGVKDQAALDRVLSNFR